MQPAPAFSPARRPSGREDIVIRLAGVSMHYGDAAEQVRVLDRLDLAVERGASVAITGPSGSGKSTLLLLLAALEKPAGGSVQIDGIDLAGLDEDRIADLRRDRIGIVFQFFHLVPSLTALDNVALPLEIAGKSGARAAARSLLERVGLAARAGHYPAQLSGGEQQRVAIARALVHSPAVILADEPTGNLDDRTGEGVNDLLFDLHRQSGATLVVVTHDMDLARRCDRVLRLHEGTLHDPGLRPGSHAARA